MIDKEMDSAYLFDIADTGNRRTFDSGAVRDISQGKGRMDLLPACAIIRLSKHFENGALKYEERNWEKGIPLHSFIDSAIRHLMNYLDGQSDEDHLCAAAWNCLCAMWTEEKRPDLQDIPGRTKDRGGTNMKHKMLIRKSTTKLSYSKPNYAEMIESAIDCEKFDFTYTQAFRVVIDDVEYKLSKHYVFLNENITLYVLER